MKRILSVLLATCTVSAYIPCYAAGDTANYTAYEDFDYGTGVFTAEMAEEAVKKGFASGWSSSFIGEETTNIVQTPYGNAIEITKNPSAAEFNITMPEQLDSSADKDYYFSFLAYVPDSGDIGNMYTQKLQFGDSNTYAGIMYGRNSRAVSEPIIKWSSATYVSDRNSDIIRGNYYRVVFKYHATAENDKASIMVYPAENPAFADWDLSVTPNTEINTDQLFFVTGVEKGGAHGIGDLKLSFYDSVEQEKNTEAEKSTEELYQMILSGSGAESISAAYSAAQELTSELAAGVAKETQEGALIRLGEYMDIVGMIEQLSEYTVSQEEIESRINGITDDKKMNAWLSEYCNIAGICASALQSGDEQDISEAKAAVDELNESEAKTRLLNELALADAEAAVKTAEETLKTEDIEKALAKVNALAESEKKEELLQRVDALQGNIAENVAPERVEEAETSLKLPDLEIAREWVEKLDEGELKQELTSRLDLVEEKINSIVPMIKDLAIDGELTAGAVLSPVWTIDDPAENAGEFAVEWQISNSEDGAYRTVSGSKDFTLENRYMGQWIRVCVTPLNTAGKSGDTKTYTVFAEKKAVIARENFDYEVNTPLRDNEKAVEADTVNGFSTGWMSDENLTNALTDNVIVRENSLVETNTASTVKIFRGLTTPVDMSENALYYITYKMRLNAGASSSANLLQRFILTPRGITDTNNQISIGYFPERTSADLPDKHFSPYLKFGDPKWLDDFEVVPGQTYNFAAMIDAVSNGTDKLSIQLVPDGQSITNEWQLEQETTTSLAYDTVGYLVYTNGAEADAFGDLMIEKYNVEEKQIISEANSALAEAADECSSEKADRAVSLMESIPSGRLKEAVIARANGIYLMAEEDSANADRIAEELDVLEQEEISKANYQEVSKNAERLRSEAEAIRNAEKRAELLDRISELITRISVAAIQFTRVTEKFDYAAGTRIDSVAADDEQGWSSGYFADPELTAPVSEDFVIANSGRLDFSNAYEIYRKLLYPIKKSETDDSFISWRFSLGSGGKVYVKAGGAEIGVSDNVYIATDSGTVRSDFKIENDTEYILVARISGNTVSVYLAEADSQAWNGISISAEIPADTDNDTVCFGGTDSALWDFAKEDVSADYLADADEAMSSLLSTKYESDAALLESEAEKMPSSIARYIYESVVKGMREEMKTLMPVVLNAGIEGSAVTGGSLRAKYNILNPYKNLKTAEITWFVNGARAGTGESIEISSGWRGRTIYYEIILYNTSGTASEPLRSQSVTVSVSGAWTGGSGGSGSIIAGTQTKKPEPVQYFSTEEPEETEEPEAAEIPFDDISEHWAKDTIIRMYDKGIVNGKSERSFAPDDSVTRAEFITMIVRALDLEPKDTDIVFNDVEEGTWYYNAVMAASSNGIADGYDDGNFYPFKELNREEMAKIIVNAYAAVNNDEVPAEEVEFDDKDSISDWSMEYIEKAYALGLIEGLDDGKYAPKKTATRAEAVTVIEKLLQVCDLLQQ